MITSARLGGKGEDVAMAGGAEASSPGCLRFVPFGTEGPATGGGGFERVETRIEDAGGGVSIFSLVRGPGLRLPQTQPFFCSAHFIHLEGGVVPLLIQHLRLCFPQRSHCEKEVSESDHTKEKYSPRQATRHTTPE